MFEKGKWYKCDNVLMYCEGIKDHKYMMLTIQNITHWDTPKIEIRRFLWEDYGNRIEVDDENWGMKKEDIFEAQSFNFHNVFEDVFNLNDYELDEDYYG